VLDASPEPPPQVPDTWSPAPAPSDLKLVRDAIADRLTSPYEQFRAARATTRGARETLARLRDTARGLASLAGVARPTPASALNGPIGPHRRWAWARTTLSDVKAIRKSLGGTVNDVVLAVITRGFRDLLQSRGENVEDRVVRTLVPVSVRTPGERGTYNNRVSAIFAELPVGIVDPTERLASVRQQMDGLKESKQAVAGEVLTSLTGFAPPLLLTLGTRVSTRIVGRIGQRNVNTVTTNVPGPQYPLYAAGRTMLEAFPFVPLGGSIRIGIAIFSYDGKLTFGVTGDYDTAPDIEVLCGGIEDGVAELLKVASP
jgi:WS/DGAT/MGAT family acyltransferase